MTNPTKINRIPAVTFVNVMDFGEERNDRAFNKNKIIKMFPIAGITLEMDEIRIKSKKAND